MVLKLKSSRGESIAETLIAVMIISLAFVILCGAVLSAGRVNEAIKNEDLSLTVTDTEYKKQNDSDDKSVTLKIKKEGEDTPILSESVATVPYITMYKDKNGDKQDLYYYYEYDES